MAWHPFRNFGLKLVALLLGALLWFTVSGQQAERTVPGVPVVYRNKPAGLEITDLQHRRHRDRSGSRPGCAG